MHHLFRGNRDSAALIVWHLNTSQRWGHTACCFSNKVTISSLLYCCLLQFLIWGTLAANPLLLCCTVLSKCPISSSPCSKRPPDKGTASTNFQHLHSTDLSRPGNSFWVSFPLTLNQGRFPAGSFCCVFQRSVTQALVVAVHPTSRAAVLSNIVGAVSCFGFKSCVSGYHSLKFYKNTQLPFGSTLWGRWLWVSSCYDPRMGGCNSVRAGVKSDHRHLWVGKRDFCLKIY